MNNSNQTSNANAEKPEVVFEQMVERGCGIDVHKAMLVATVRGVGLKEETREFKCFTTHLESLRDWLLECKVTHVAVESTGVYWKPVFNILESNFNILVVNARHVKNVPGHKTDKKDSKWLAKLLLSGLLKGSFIPPLKIRELRDLTRYKKKVIEQVSSEKNRIQKILEDCNIKLSSVVSDMDGAVATRIINGLLSGQSDGKELAKMRHGKMKCSEEELAESLKGVISPHHKFMLRVIKESIEEKLKTIQKIDEEIDAHIKNHELTEEVELLTGIPGVGKEGALNIVSEIGVDMECFPNEQHLASWAGMSPGNNESAGKKKVVE